MKTLHSLQSEPVISDEYKRIAMAFHREYAGKYKMRVRNGVLEYYNVEHWKVFARESYDEWSEQTTDISTFTVEKYLQGQYE